MFSESNIISYNFELLLLTLLRLVVSLVLRVVTRLILVGVPKDTPG